ncbi:unnamed protein product [Caenorhabditis angaria]|uniref:Uncharacterized protein n=1 Tax=Caenorhabditis angaria TaxID=860376 RepID=A0A9P1ISM9_9PELO|nr:unnamed protein product [Caenorhabditis angaria]
MSDTHWNHALQISGQIGFTLSLISNTILIFLIHFRSNRQIGSYKYILMLFCVFTMFYSCVEMFLRPFLHIYDDTLFLIQRKWFDLGKTVTRVLSSRLL